MAGSLLAAGVGRGRQLTAGTLLTVGECTLLSVAECTQLTVGTLLAVGECTLMSIAECTLLAVAECTSLSVGTLLSVGGYTLMAVGTLLPVVGRDALHCVGNCILVFVGDAALLISRSSTSVAEGCN